MLWLIDGHNVIGQLQDLSLDDPYDEAKLTQAIRRYVMRGNGKVKAIIYFDNGLPGGFSKELSSHYVEVIFAPPRTPADRLIMKRASALRAKSQEFVLVTSDDHIRQLGFAYGLEMIASEEFALLIGFRPVEVPDDDDSPQSDANQPRKTRTVILYDKDPNPVISQQEINYWLPIFQHKLHQVRAAKAAKELAERQAAQESAERRRLERERLKQTGKKKRP
mgnify:CR=1 FL=1